MIEAIEARLKELIPPDTASLFEGARYSLLAPGKRIRPLLTLFTAEMLQPGSQKRALTPACALEMVHCYSLIHDDLPCMDDDDFRRGRPTLHKAYSEAHAVLVGDYLLTYAFDVLAHAPELSADQKLATIQTLSKTAGGEGMIGGQMMDIEASGDVSVLHQRKTAALFQCAVAFGAIVAEASDTSKEQLLTFGRQFGELFQLADDLLDGDHPLGERHARASLSQVEAAALSTLEELPFPTSSLEALTRQITQKVL